MRRRADTARPGVALLEVLVALAILGFVGAAVASLAVDAADAVRRARAADTEMRRASALVDAVARWPRQDLELRLGTRRQGPWRLHVDRPAPSLYTVELADSVGGRVLLRSALFRAPPMPGRHASR
jgi:prepilin-type N-terminal cleavage/methylation domain-containing protein